MRLFGTQMGQGAPICLLHGLFGRSQNFATLARHLSATHRVISLDLRNHGASPHAEAMGYADMAADVLETLDGLGVVTFALLGHSMGGKVAMMTALHAPHRIRALIVADIAPVAYRHANLRVAEALRAIRLSPGLDRRAADRALAADLPDPSLRAFLLQNLDFAPVPAWKIGLNQIAGGMADIEGWPDPHGHYEGPSLFIAGGRSDYVRPDFWPGIRALFPHARLETLADADHWLHAEQPAAFAGRIDAFLAGGAVAHSPADAV